MINSRWLRRTTIFSRERANATARNEYNNLMGGNVAGNGRCRYSLKNEGKSAIDVGRRYRFDAIDGCVCLTLTPL